jgi:SEL1 protein
MPPAAALPLVQALLLYLQASELGMEIGQSNAAWMLDRGFAHAGHQAASVATALFKRSAEQGNVMSLLQLGDCYYYGSGVEQVGCCVCCQLWFTG